MGRYTSAGRNAEIYDMAEIRLYVLAEVRCLTGGSFRPRSGAEPWLLRVGDSKSCNAGTDSRVVPYDVGGRWRESDLTRTVWEWWYEDLHCRH